MNYTYKPKIYPPSNSRNSISFRGSSKYANIINTFQRIKTIEKLKLRGIETEPISYKKHLKELRSAMISISPFGYGEICFRDFEIILAGALMLKPSMDHLQTYPDFYIENETYIPFKWDFSDFDMRVDNLLDHRDTINKISMQAQERYKYYFSDQGMDVFFRRFHDMLGTKDQKCLDKGVAVHAL